MSKKPWQEGKDIIFTPLNENTVESLVKLVETGELQPGMRTVPAEELPRDVNCTCQHIFCCCAEMRKHTKQDCPALCAIRAPFDIPCEAHDDDICLICYPCSCTG